MQSGTLAAPARSENARKRAQRARKKAAARGVAATGDSSIEAQQQQRRTSSDIEATHLVTEAGAAAAAAATMAGGAAQRAQQQQVQQQQQLPISSNDEATHLGVEADAAEAAAAAHNDREARALSTGDIDINAQRILPRHRPTQPELEQHDRVCPAPAKLHPLVAPYADHELFAWMRAARPAYDDYYCSEIVEGDRWLLSRGYPKADAVESCVNTLFLVASGHAKAPIEQPIKVQLRLDVGSEGAVGARLSLCPAVEPAPPLPAALVSAMEEVTEMAEWDAEGAIAGCGGDLELLSAQLAEAQAEAAAAAREDARQGGPRAPYVARRHTLGALDEEGTVPDTPLVGKAKPPDLGRLEWQQQMLVDATGVFVKATRARLGEATAAQFYGWQRSVIGHLTALQLDEQCVLEAALAECPAVAKVDARGSPVLFARELASYLAHCDKVGGLALATELERSPFVFFFRTLNRHLVQLAAQAAAEGARLERAEIEGAGSGSEEGGSEGDDGYGQDSDEDECGFDFSFGAGGVLQQERASSLSFEEALRRLEEKDEHDAWLRDKTDEILDKMWLEEREKRRREKRRLVRRSPKPGRAPRWAPEEAPITE